MRFGQVARARRALVIGRPPGQLVLSFLPRPASPGFGLQEAPGAGAGGHSPPSVGVAPGAGASGIPPPELAPVPRARRARRLDLGSGRVHPLVVVAARCICLACGRAFQAEVGLADLGDCPGWAPFLSALALHVLRSDAGALAMSALPPGHVGLAAAFRRGLLPRLLPLLRPREPV